MYRHSCTQERTQYYMSELSQQALGQTKYLYMYMYILDMYMCM